MTAWVTVVKMKYPTCILGKSLEEGEYSYNLLDEPRRTFQLPQRSIADFSSSNSIGFFFVVLKTKVVSPFTVSISRLVCLSRLELCGFTWIMIHKKWLSLSLILQTNHQWGKTYQTGDFAFHPTDTFPFQLSWKALLLKGRPKFCSLYVHVYRRLNYVCSEPLVTHSFPKQHITQFRIILAVTTHVQLCTGRSTCTAVLNE